uniref:Delta-6 fatty acid desaturase n=1 Tax=Stichopus japonicus TaxID=307972 RepID=A0A1R7SVA5_STIJA|nr:delta-6 fatty acid desaturase [Apostichopus japonicus]
MILYSKWVTLALALVLLSSITLTRLVLVIGFIPLVSSKDKLKMGKGENSTTNSRIRKELTWEEVRKNNGVKGSDKWIVINGEVYDVTKWSKKHPGGSKVISHYAGQDATEPFEAFHAKPDFVGKFMKAIHIGQMSPDEYQQKEIVQDLRVLKETAVKMGLSKPSYFFYFCIIGHILAMEVAAFFIQYYYGFSLETFVLSVALMTIAQVQGGWAQHDFGHLSVFKSSRLNHLLHFFTMSVMKGASSKWWNHLHYQHHAKPNIIGKDPDVRQEALFVLGETMPVKVAKSGTSTMPYNHQAKYFPFLGPPLLFPVYFQFMLFRYIWTRREWTDLLCVSVFYARFALTYGPTVGILRAFMLYEATRILESIWFTWVAQSNHLPMDIEEDTEKPWVELQLAATCNIEKSAFNDWFTGHLNFQIEHHIFPTMPRHHLHRIAPYVKSLCEKHGIKYTVKTMSDGFLDNLK